MALLGRSKSLMDMERAKGFEPCARSSQAAHSQGVTESALGGHTQIRAQIPGPSDPDLVQVLHAWPALSHPLKAAILAIVGSQKEAP